MNTAPIDKNAIRSQYLAARGAISAAQAVTAAHELAHVAQAIAFTDASVIAAYMPVRGEMDVRPLAAWLRTQGHQLCLPVVQAQGAPLLFRTWKADALLVKGRYGIDVPAEHESLVEPQFLLVPLVAYDDAGTRLGYGAGFYDCTIAQLRAQNKALQVAGIAYAAQHATYIPRDVHDAPLDMVITEKGITRFT